MDEADSTHGKTRNRRGLAVPGLLACLIVSALAFSAAESAAAAECPADYCTERATNENGFYLLMIPAGGIALIAPSLADCKWEVEAQFSDGSPTEFYSFDASKSFQSSHTFPEPGVYFVDIYATEGVHGGDSTPCPDLHIQAKVTYPEPAAKETGEPGPEQPLAHPPAGGGAVAGSQPPAGAPPAGSSPVPYWRACGGGVRAHLVSCPKARKVIRAARDLLSRARLARGAVFQAGGFSCRLRHGTAGSVSCRRGRQRVLGT